MVKHFFMDKGVVEFRSAAHCTSASFPTFAASQEDEADLGVPSSGLDVRSGWLEEGGMHLYALTVTGVEVPCSREQSFDASKCQLLVH